MARVKVKICGIRTLEEARAAVELGADALGFNLWNRSPRYISPDEIRHILVEMPPFVSCVGVFVNEEPEAIRRTVTATGLQVVQLHGDEDEAFVKHLGDLKIIKALRIDEAFDLDQLNTCRASAILLDAKVKGEYGGTGQRFDWRLAVEAKKTVRVILAGGLSRENIGEAIRFVRPYAVDVCSGVEAEPGRKDFDKMREFMAAVEGANQQ
jgi:phosphoribosylanthranilate isomerase